MANKCIKKCSNYLIIKVKQMKTTLILPQLEWPYSRVITITNAGEDVAK
jgi:hypothetical protein